ncbi:MAG: AAA family ATPase [Lachnospira sp.]|nr:AAA family ATPase [Lachnospira sp.]
MKIHECFVENFGVLHEYRYQPEPGLSVVYNKNGTGKSTFAAFIRAMFYGMAADRTRKNLENAERRRYKPWQGGVWGGYICFSVKDKSYRLERTFGEKEREDTFRLTDLDTGLCSNDYSENIGFELFGVDKEAYSATAFVNWKYMQVQVNESMTSQLANMADFSGMEKSKRAIELLEDEYKQYVKTGNRGELAQLEKEISMLSMQEWKLKSELKEKREELENIFSEEEQNKKMDLSGLSLSEEEKERLCELDDYFAAGMPDTEQADIKSYKNDKRSLIYIAACVIVVASIILPSVVMQKSMKYVVWIIPVVVFATVMAVTLRRRRLFKAQQKEAENAREYKYLSEKEEAYEAAQKHMQELKSDHVEKMLKKESERLELQLDETNKKLVQVKERKTKIEQRALLLMQTKEYLVKARTCYTANLLDGISTAFYRYLKEFDSLLAEKVRLDADYGIELLENGIYRKLDYYSSGIKDIIWLCERMAFTEKLFADEKPLIVLDDPFVSMDSEMKRKAFGLLEGLAKDFQIVYLSCHERENV